MFVWWALVNLFLAVVAIGVTLWAFVQDRGYRVELIRLTEAKKCPPKVLVSAKPQIYDEVPTAAPPQDEAKSGYIGPAGTDIMSTMKLELEALRDDRPDALPERVRLGSQQVLPSNTIHVVNLWATWCTPCIEELPDFKAMFARRAKDWGDKVRFVPIQVKDGAAPEAAYRDKTMPPAPFKLADRGMNDPLVTALSADDQQKLFKGNLPVTLVLDCNRRVRWAQFNQLHNAQFKELEGYVDRFLEELADDKATAWCKQEWPGNGRCEGLENTAKFHNLEDCGPLKKTIDPADPNAPPAELLPPPVAAPTCPEGNEVLPDGRCKPQLLGVKKVNKPKPTILATCGNGKCDGREDTSNCCEDCPCEAPMVCKQMGASPKRCLLPGLQKK
jgi:thiol-disulfide isomerase/thioredoxin